MVKVMTLFSMTGFGVSNNRLNVGLRVGHPIIARAKTCFLHDGQ